MKASNHSAEDRAKFVAMGKKEGRAAAAKAAGVSQQTISNWGAPRKRRKKKASKRVARAASKQRANGKANGHRRSTASAIDQALASVQSALASLTEFKRALRDAFGGEG